MNTIELDPEKLDPLDLLPLLANWVTDPGGPPDFDGDGTVGILDLLTLLANWGAGPVSGATGVVPFVSTPVLGHNPADEGDVLASRVGTEQNHRIEHALKTTARRQTDAVRRDIALPAAGRDQLGVRAR